MSLEELAISIQEEGHQCVEYIISRSEKAISVQDATNAFFYRKLAELQLQINELKQGLP